MKNSLALVWILFLFVTACAELKVINPNPRVDLPMTRGQSNRANLHLPLNAAHRYNTIENAGARPPNFAEKSVDQTQDFSPGASYSVDDSLDVGLETHLFNIFDGAVGIGMNLKWQPIGAPITERRAGNFPVALSLRAGVTSGQNDGDQAVTFGPGGFPWRGIVTSTYTQAGVSFGYQPRGNLLIYTGAATGNYDVRTRIEQTTTQSSQGGNYEDNTSGYGVTGGLGVAFLFRRFNFYLAGEYSKIGYEQLNATEELWVHLGFNILLGGLDGGGE